MNFRESNQESTEAKYISKRVMINGQFVTLYSANGQTWLSSPEDIPALMDRLDNARVTLNTAEKVAEGESAKVAQPEKTPKQEPQEAPEKALSSKYRVKGPKPRPILRQDGVVIKGTPIEPISASATVMGFSSDVKPEAEVGSAAKTAKSANSARSVKARETKLIAPLVSKKVVRATAKAPVAAGKDASKTSSKQAPSKQLKHPASKQVSAPATAKIKAEKLVTKAAKSAKASKQTASTKQPIATKVKRAATSRGAKKADIPSSKKSQTTKKVTPKARRARR